MRWSDQASIIIPIRVTNRVFECYLENFSYCAESVSKQTIPCETIIVDFGSSLKYKQKIRSICKQHKYVYIRGYDDIWSRSRSLNLGIYSCNGKRVLLVDSDCVLPPNYVEEHLAFTDPKTVTYSALYDTKKKVPKTSDINILKRYLGEKLRSMSHICVDHDWLLNNGAFNPQYEGWGAEDEDLLCRMQKSGLKRKFLKVFPYHLWHPSYETLMNKIDKGNLYDKLLNKNRQRLKKDHKKVFNSVLKERKRVFRKLEREFLK